MKSKHLFITTILIILSSSLTVKIKNAKAETSMEPSYSGFDGQIDNAFVQDYTILKIPRLYSDLIKIYKNENYFRSIQEDYYYDDYTEKIVRENHKKALQLIPEEIEQRTKELHEILGGDSFFSSEGYHTGQSVFYNTESYLKFGRTELMICVYRSIGIPDEIIQERLDEVIDYLYTGIDNDVKREINFTYAEWKEEYNNDPKYKKNVEDYVENAQMFLPYYKKGVTSIMSFHVKSADRECRPNQPNYFVRRKDLQFLKRTLD